MRGDEARHLRRVEARVLDFHEVQAREVQWVQREVAAARARERRACLVGEGGFGGEGEGKGALLWAVPAEGEAPDAGGEELEVGV